MDSGPEQPVSGPKSTPLRGGLLMKSMRMVRQWTIPSHGGSSSYERHGMNTTCHIASKRAAQTEVHRIVSPCTSPTLGVDNRAKEHIGSHGDQLYEISSPHYTPLSPTWSHHVRASTFPLRTKPPKVHAWQQRDESSLISYWGYPQHERNRCNGRITAS